MFNLIEKNQALVKGIMLAVIAAFVLWGIGGYLGMSGDDGYIAKVGKTKIYSRDIDAAIEQNPQNTDKMQVLFGLINRQLLITHFDSYHMSASNAELQQQISSIPLFLDNGKFSAKKYEDFLKQRLMTAEQFQTEISKQILLDQTLNFFKTTYFTSAGFNQQFTKLLSRQRSVSTYVIDPAQFYTQIKISDKEISDYYQQNIAQFTLPEQAKFQYLTLVAETIAKNIKPTDAEINKYLTDHKTATSQVDVSHILFAVPATADAAAKSQIKAKAEKILAEVKANPSKFASLAKQYSEDPISAKNGGDLGYFSKGVMVKPFEDVAFSLKPGQISQLVETQYGYHILKMNNVKQLDNSALKATAIAALQKQQSTTILQKQLEQLNDLTYNQPGSLEPAAKKLGLAIQTSGWIRKGESNGEFANPKIQQAVFNKDVTVSHNNSEVVNLGDGGYSVYRVLEYKPAQTQTLDQTKEQIINQLKLKEASALAYKQGQTNINNLQNGKLQLSFGPTENITLLGQSKIASPMAVKQIFSVNLTKTPAYTGSVNDKGAFVIYKINSENIDPKLDAQNTHLLDQFNQNNAMLDLGAYLGYLRTKYEVNYKLERLSHAGQQSQ